MNIVYQNIQCLRNKIEEVEEMTAKENIDVLCLTEHWLSREEVLFCKINDLKLISSYSWETAIHGGCSVFATNAMEFQERPELGK